MESVLVFAALGLLTGAAARLLYPQRRWTHALGTMLIGMLGAIAGGMVSWYSWPAEEDGFQTGNLILSVLGSMLAILLGAGIAYKRNLR